MDEVWNSCFIVCSTEAVSTTAMGTWLSIASNEFPGKRRTDKRRTDTSEIGDRGEPMMILGSKNLFRGLLVEP